MRRMTWGVAALAAALACGDATGVAAGALIGTWEATKIEFVNVANNGRFTLTVRALGGQESESGNWEIQDGDVVLRADVDPDPVRLEAQISGDRLTASTTDAEYDFDGDGRDDPARLNLTLTRT